MNKTFSVDPRLTSLLSENYRSTEVALKELIDNSWDADATEVYITLPQVMTNDPLIISDDGTGMSINEVESEYLKIARNRITHKGERTKRFNRKIKGRKGIGKFAGLAIASNMNISTFVKGEKIGLEISRKILDEQVNDLEKLEIPITLEKAHNKLHGTVLTLSNLLENRTYPKADKLTEILIYEYGRESGFSIFINKNRIGIEDIAGELYDYTEEIPNVGAIKYQYKIADDKKLLKTPGIVLKVNGKVVGVPSFFGLENDDTIPSRVLKRVYGEVSADALEPDVTADWGAIIENSETYNKVKDAVKEKVVASLKEVYYRDFNLQKARLQKKIYDKIKNLPEYKREFAEKEIQKVIARFYDESEEKIDLISSFVLDAIEKDEYFLLLQKLENSKDLAVGILAGVLDEFGVLETGLVLRQVSVRLSVLDSIDTLINNSETVEADIHKALENNLWIFGRDNQLIASNITLKNVINNYLDKEFKDKPRANKRPDLLLVEKYAGDVLLIEFKRPNMQIGRDHENQAEKYRDDLLNYIASGKINVLVIGGRIDPNYKVNYQNNNLKLITYNDVVSKARSEIQWLVSELSRI